MADYFKAGAVRKFTVPQIAEYYRERNMAAIVFGVDAMHVSGREQTPDQRGDRGAGGRCRTPTCSSRSRASIRIAARRACGRPGGWSRSTASAASSSTPTSQGFFPNDRMAYPLYEVIAEHGLIALFHTGQTGVGRRAPRAAAGSG